MAQNKDDLSRYSKDKYAARRLQREQEEAERFSSSNARVSRVNRAKQRMDNSELVDDYSRNNASSRYVDRTRHLSYGGVKDARPAAAVAEMAAEGPRVKQGGRWRKILIAVLVLLLLACVAWYVYLCMVMKPSADVSGSVTAEKFGQPYYVLLLGSDSRNEDEDVARADSIMLARVDEGKKQVTLISLPRDLLVNIEGHGQGKLNSALTYNGVAGAIDAASELAGVPISYYATIYFSGFKDLVDALGGVTVEVPEGTYYKGVTVPAGKAVEINGEEALVLARCRHGNPPDQGAYAAGDYQRTLNQRNLMKAIAKKALTQPVFMLPGTVTTVATCIETNMPPYKLAIIALAMRGMDTDGMYMAVVPATSSYINGGWYEVVNESAWSAMMERVDAGEDPND